MRESVSSRSYERRSAHKLTRPTSPSTSFTGWRRPAFPPRLKSSTQYVSPGKWNAIEDSGSAPAVRTEADGWLLEARLRAGRLVAGTPLPPQQCPPWPRTLTTGDRAALGEAEYQRLLREGVYVAG